MPLFVPLAEMVGVAPGKPKAGGGLGCRGGGDDAVGDQKGFHHVAIALVKNQMVEVGGRTPNAANRTWQRLHDLAVVPVEAVGAIVMTHVVAIQQVDFSFLAARPQSGADGPRSRRNRAATTVRPDPRSASADCKPRLVVRREIIRHRQPVAGGGKLDETVAVIAAVGVGAERAVAPFQNTGWCWRPRTVRCRPSRARLRRHVDRQTR